MENLLTNDNKLVDVSINLAPKRLTRKYYHVYGLYNEHRSIGGTQLARLFRLIILCNIMVVMVDDVDIYVLQTYVIYC